LDFKGEFGKFKGEFGSLKDVFGDFKAINADFQPGFSDSNSLETLGCRVSPSTTIDTPPM